MKRLLAIAGLCVMPTSQAAEWVRVSVIDVHQHTYDNSKILVEGDQVTYWRRVTFRAPQRTTSGMATRAMYRERVDCRAHTHTTLQYLLYAADASVLENVHTPDAAAQPVIPETVGDQFEKLMCAMAPQVLADQRSLSAPTPPTAGALRDEIEFLEARLRILREQLEQQSPPPPALETTPAPQPSRSNP